jgi:hypothetical protein
VIRERGGEAKFLAGNVAAEGNLDAAAEAAVATYVDRIRSSSVDMVINLTGGQGATWCSATLSGLFRRRRRVLIWWGLAYVWST